VPHVVAPSRSCFVFDNSNIGLPPAYTDGPSQRPDSAAPDVGRSSPMIMRMVVDLPAPFGPRNPVTVPGAIVVDRPSCGKS
jgi:hypothetical protein